MYYSKKLNNSAHIKHAFFSRRGGYSKGLYKGLNCGRGSGDLKKNISKNLEYVARKMDVKRKNLILMNQTHSSKVIEINMKNYNKKINSDAIFTRLKGLALGVVTADCVPILFYDKKKLIVGCIHAGWKGAIKNIIKKTILKIKKLSPDSQIFASIGPCIGQKNYEVENSFFKKFTKKSNNNKKYFSKKNSKKKLFNLRGYVASKLLELEIEIDHVNYDTFKEKNKFYSYRRSKILNQRDYGRCISVIKLT